MVSRFARCDLAIMATGTRRSDGCMVKVSRYPGIRTMAVITDIISLNMRCILASRCGAIMAGRACCSDTAVVEACGYPSIGSMAIITDVISL